MWSKASRLLHKTSKSVQHISCFTVCLADMASPSIVVLVLVMLAVGVYSQQRITNQTAAQEFLDMYNTEAQQVFNNAYTLSWNYEANITTENQQKSVRPSLCDKPL